MIVDFLIQSLWESQTDAVIDIILGESDCDTYKKDSMKPLLIWWGGNKILANMVRIATSNRKVFLCFSFYWWHDWKGRPVSPRDLSRLMSEKMEEPISHVRGWINCQIEIALVRSY